MNTYTYKSGVGVVSHSDINNFTTYFVYDAFGRLHYTKDENGNVLKVFDYRLRD
jgi:hypothetical protein